MVEKATQSYCVAEQESEGNIKNKKKTISETGKKCVDKRKAYLQSLLVNFCFVLLRFLSVLTHLRREYPPADHSSLLRSIPLVKLPPGRKITKQ